MTFPEDKEVKSQENLPAKQFSSITRRDLLPRILIGVDLGGDLLKIYRSGLREGHSTGFLSIDPYYTISPGQWTLVTGIPGHGKSEFIDAVMVNLANRESEKWVFAIFSPENNPQALHAEKIIEKYIGKPMRPGPTARMSEDEIISAIEWMKSKFGFVESQEQVNSVNDVLDECWRWLCYNKDIYTNRGIVIDPWNELEHKRPSGLSETEYISQTLSDVRRFARNFNCHIWLVAHPSKLYKDKEGNRPVPSPYDVSGSAHWYNKADNCITVYREMDSQTVQIHIQKVRFKHCGKPGLVELLYDRVNGRYYEKDDSVIDKRRREYEEW